jgi:hypothetical protein
MWLEACARRIGELDASMESLGAEQVAIRLWYGSDTLASYRDMHPVAAAESWLQAYRTQPIGRQERHPARARH